MEKLKFNNSVEFLVLLVGLHKMNIMDFLNISDLLILEITTININEVSLSF